MVPIIPEITKKHVEHAWMQDYLVRVWEELGPDTSARMDIQIGELLV
jgi:hypothetical protein